MPSEALRIDMVGEPEKNLEAVTRRLAPPEVEGESRHPDSPGWPLHVWKPIPLRDLQGVTIRCGSRS